MMGKPQSLEPKLFYTRVNISERIPSDYPLRRVKELVDFAFVRKEVKGFYGYNGNVSLDPPLVLKLQFLLFYENVRSERELMKILPLRLDWLWFCDLDLDAAVPDHSVLSKARQRWGLETYEKVFIHILRQCAREGLIGASTEHVDSTLLKGNASVDSRIPRKLWERLEQARNQEQTTQYPQASDDSDNAPPTQGADVPAHPPVTRTPPPPEDTQASQLPPPPQGPFNTRTVSRTDPDSATMKRRGRGTILGYLDHSLMDDKHGVIISTIATPADYDDGAMLPALLDKQQQYLQRLPDRVVGDSAYGTEANRELFGQQGIQAYLKQRTGRHKLTGDWTDYLPDDCDPRRAKQLMKRRSIVAEGRFATAHVRHGHRQCRWRRRWRVQIQCYLVAMVQNIGKLIRYARRLPPAVAAAAPMPTSSLLLLIDSLYQSLSTQLLCHSRCHR
jgi:transposase